jgi:hypothetical protein
LTDHVRWIAAQVDEGCRPEGYSITARSPRRGSTPGKTCRRTTFTNRRCGSNRNAIQIAIWKGDPDIWLYTKNNSLVAALHALVAGGGTIAVVARARVVPGEDQRVPGDNV